MKVIKFIIFMQFIVQVYLSNDTLVLVHVFVRHCDRTPDIGELYQKSPYYSEINYAPHGYGQLTNVGKKRCYDVGTSLRQRYDGFLNSSYHYSLIEARSSDYVRTKESLQLVLAGLFPPTDELMWLNGMKWIPIATVYDKKEKDKMLYPFGNKKYVEELQKFEKSNEAHALRAPYKYLMEYVSQQIEEPVDFARLCYLTRGMVLMEGLGLKLPSWLNSTQYDLAKQTLDKYFSYATGTKQIVRIFAGYLLRKIVEDTELKINGSLSAANRKMFIYGAHGYNINIIFKALNIWDGLNAPVGSYCIFEVHYIDGRYGFKLFHYNYTSIEPRLIPIPGFGEFAPIGEFKIRNRDFFQLQDLDEPSLSTMHRISSSFVLIVPFVILKIV